MLKRVRDKPEKFELGYRTRNGCRCTKGCKKSYCVCKAAGIRCGPKCSCEDCENGKCEGHVEPLVVPRTPPPSPSKITPLELDSPCTYLSQEEKSLILEF